MLIDVSRFPLVFIKEPEASQADEPLDLKLGELLDRGERFVLLTDHLPGDHEDEPAEQRKAKALFFKQNRQRFRQLCQGLILITDGRTVPAPVRLAAQAAGKALGLSMAFVITEQEALDEAARLLACA